MSLKGYSVKNLSIAPYTQKEADAAAGMGSYIPPAPMVVASMEELQALRKSVAEALAPVEASATEGAVQA